MVPLIKKPRSGRSGQGEIMAVVKLPDYRPKIGMIGMKKTDDYIEPSTFPILDIVKRRVYIRPEIPITFRPNIPKWKEKAIEGPESWFVTYLNIGDNPNIQKVYEAYGSEAPPEELLQIYRFLFQLDMALTRADPLIFRQAFDIWGLKHGGLDNAGLGMINRPQVLH